MIFFPFLQTLDREHVVGILRSLFMYGAQTFDEMRGRIDMITPLADMREQLGKKTRAHCVRPFVIPIKRLMHLVWKAGASAGYRVQTHA